MKQNYESTIRRWFVLALLLFISLASVAQAGTYFDLEPCLSTKSDADQTLGKPIRVVLEGIRYDYSPEKGNALRISISYDQDTGVIRTITIYLKDNYFKSTLLEWLSLDETPESLVDDAGNLSEHYRAEGIVLRYDGPDETSPIGSLSYICAEEDSGEELPEGDFEEAKKPGPEEDSDLVKQLREQTDIIKTDLREDEIGKKKAETAVSGIANKVYLGAGVGYAIEHFRDELSDYDLGNSLSLSAKAGYFACENLAFEVMFQYLTDFKHEESGSSYSLDYHLRGYFFTANAKVCLPIGSVVSPYAVVGAGFAIGRLTGELDYSGGTISDSETHSGACGRCGGGLDIFLSDHLALEGEVSFNAGAGDISDIGFTNLTLNGFILF